MDDLIEKRLSNISTSVDIAKIPPIHQKRLLTFVNHFIITTVSFLNNFAQTCERKLLSCNQKMQTLEAALCILEAKLNSIPDLADGQSTNMKEKTHDEDYTENPPDIMTATTFNGMASDFQK